MRARGCGLVWSVAKVEAEEVIANAANRMKALLVDEIKVFIGVAGR